MASEAFQQTVETIKELVESSGLADDELNLTALRSLLSTSPFSVSESAEVIKVSAGGVPAEWIIEPEVNPARRLLYLHGGWFAAGGLESHRPLASWLSKATACAVLLIDYRLAPENPFPAAVEDSLSAYHWMVENGAFEGKIADRLFIGGDSAGGSLTLATLLGLKNGAARLPDAAVTLSAVTDAAVTGNSMATRADVDIVVRPGHARKAAEMYLAGQDVHTPLASPLYGDLAGLPPILMQVGDAEVLLDDSVRFAEKAEQAGVKVTLEVWPEMFHVWQRYAQVFPEAQQALDRIGEYVRSF